MGPTILNRCVSSVLDKHALSGVWRGNDYACFDSPCGTTLYVDGYRWTVSHADLLQTEDCRKEWG
jgi:hypothetical protein